MTNVVVGSKWVCKVDNPLSADTVKGDVITVARVGELSNIVDYYIDDPNHIWLAELEDWHEYFKPFRSLKDTLSMAEEEFISKYGQLDVTPKDIKEKDNVNSPAHYGQGKIEAIEYIEDFLTREEYIGYLRGNIAKYNHRWRYKGGVEDLKKAEWYHKRLIQTMENEI